MMNFLGHAVGRTLAVGELQSTQWLNWCLMIGSLPDKRVLVFISHMPDGICMTLFVVCLSVFMSC